MVKTLALLIAAGMLAACGSNHKATPEPAPQSVEKGC